jgi:uncharacterized protein YbaR (Trm112 family)
MERVAPELLEILACPRCHGPLRYAEPEAALDCPACRLRFRVEAGVPVLLLSEARPLPG